VAGAAAAHRPNAGRVRCWPAPTDRYQWHIEIAGKPSVRMVLDALPSLDGSGEAYDPGFYATMATAINAIPYICNAPTGLFHQPVFAPWRRRP
jgi:hypothetical protein